MCETGKSLAELTADLVLLPQVMINVRVKERFDPYSRDSVRAVVDSVNAQLAGRGRVVLRASGTEPLIRVMVEAEESATARGLAQRIADAVQAGV
jgi:phosphoglucosamine mutase